VKKTITLVLLLLAFTPFLVGAGNQAKVDFNRFFLDRTMRIDYYHLGDNQQEVIALDKIYDQASGPVRLKP